MQSNNPAQRQGAVMGASGSIADTQPTREPETAAAMSGLNSQINDLRERLVALRERLEPVMRSEPQGETGNKIARAYNSPLATRIADCSERIDELRYQVESMLNKLEV